jgi:hypothetical protein
VKKTFKARESQNEKLPSKADYVVTAVPPGDLTKADLAACIAIVKKGDAVDGDAAARELCRAKTTAVVRTGEEVVGLGAIKRIRFAYASGISSEKKSGFAFDPNMPEIGYIAVVERHQNHGLSRRIVERLLCQETRLFATTSNDYMTATLEGCGFVNRGRKWPGRKGNRLSLWIKD